MVENSLTHVSAIAPRLPAGRRIYVIGDVHGHRAKLQQVHDRIRADLARRPVAAPVLVHLGDLIDRGPDSAGCLALLADGPPLRGVPTINLMGNHEWMLLQAFTNGAKAATLGGSGADDIDRWLDNGGAQTLTSWGLKSTMPVREWLAGIPPRHLVLMHGLRPYWATDGYLFVHAGVRPGIPLAKQRETDLLWIRESFLKWDGVMLPETPQRMIVHGHTPQPTATLKHNRIGLDTGAGKGGPLTCAILERNDVSLFQVETP